jgi:hypothetical protein
LLSEGVSEAIHSKDYNRLGEILKFAYDRKILLRIDINDVIYIVDNKEVEIMRVLVKALV